MRRELVSFHYLRDFASFLLKNHLDALVKEDIKRAKEVNLPLLKLFAHLSEQELFELSKKGMIEYLTQIIEGNSLDAIIKSMKDWKEDNVPGIPRDKVVASDLALIYNVRKHSLLNLLSAYTSDINIVIPLIKEIEDFYTFQESLAIQTFAFISKDELSKRENRLKEAQALAQLGWWEYDLENNLVNWSDELLQIYGLNRSDFTIEVIGKHIYQEDIEPLMNKVKEIYKNGGSFTHEYRIRNSSGETRFLIDKGYTEEVHGKILVKGISQDITDRKVAEQENYKLKSLVDASQDFIALADMEGNSLYINEAGQTLIGIENHEEVFKTKLIDMFPLSQREHVQNFIFPEVFRHGHWEGDVQFRNFKTNELIDVTWNVFQVKNVLGKSIGLGCVSQDIRPRKKYESLVKAKQNQLEEAQNIAHLGSWEWDVNQNIVSWSDEMYRLFGYDPGEIEVDFERYMSHMFPDDKEIMSTVISRCYTQHIPYTIENRIIRKDGSVRWLYCKGKVSVAEGDKALKLSGIAMDITSDKKKEAALRQRTKELEASNKELEAFCYTISHDLRSPLRAIDGFGRRLANQYGQLLDYEGQRLLNVVRTNAQQMGVLIDSLLDFSRLNRRELNKIPIDMNEMVKKVIEEISQQQSLNKVSFYLGDFHSAMADNNLIRQVWQNLISNAIKFSSKKEESIIEIGSEEKGDEIIYFVKDNGAGFDMEYANKLFGVFQRLHSEDDFKGTGVGLATVYRIVHRHGGKVWAFGEPDKGAVFYFTLQSTKEIKQKNLYLEKNQ